jgi:hypothetical protein
MSIFEIGMLVCFGAAWPASIAKSYRSRSTEGKSIVFLMILFVGYIFGILHKLIYRYDVVIFLYILNSIMVFTDIMLFFRNKHIERSA